MRIQFGDYRLDDQCLLLERAGERVSIRPKVFDLLVELVRERERVVPREELTAALWGSDVVGAGSLSGLVNELRKTLGETGRGPSSIRTVHARGYQFVAPVEFLDERSGEVASHALASEGAPADRAESSGRWLRGSEADGLLPPGLEQLLLAHLRAGVTRIDVIRRWLDSPAARACGLDVEFESVPGSAETGGPLDQAPRRVLRRVDPGSSQMRRIRP